MFLPKGQQWHSVSANIFEVVDGKKILFEDKESLFAISRKWMSHVIVTRQKLASAMRKEEIHQDIQNFFTKLKSVVSSDIVI